jgi:SAM-dependent methyltransferase
LWALDTFLDMQKMIQPIDMCCPMTGQTDVEIVERFRTADLVWLYRHYTGVDVATEFDRDEILLVRNPRIDFYFFWPSVSGSVRFYEDLYERMGYPEDRGEYRYAAKFINQNASVLDVGCGSGLFRAHVPETRYTGLEFNPKSVEKGRRRGINIFQTPVEEVAEAQQKFDVVVLFQVLEHVANPGAFFDACVRCTAEDGLLIVSVPNAAGYTSRRENTYLNYPPHHVTWWSLKSFLHLAGQFELDIADYTEDKLISLPHFAEVVLKDRINRILKRSERRVRRSPFDRALSRTLYQVGRLLPRPELAIAPNGHSITVVFRRRGARTA